MWCKVEDLQYGRMRVHYEWIAMWFDVIILCVCITATLRVARFVYIEFGCVIH